MKTIPYFHCEKCNMLFEHEIACAEHEKTCLPLEEGDRGLFLVAPETRVVGRVTQIGRAKHPCRYIGANDPYVCIEAEEPLGYSVMKSFDGGDGIHFNISWSDVQSILEPVDANTA